MHHFFELVVLPAFDAVGASRVVEIGALRGAMTRRLLQGLGPQAELHVIDPLPEFDPTKHERAFGGRYVFHRDLSLRALPAIPAADVALIDGDHNWYTVFHELKLLTATAREAGRPMPLMIMHDVGWPYGRRDLYYDPKTIPEQYRHAYAKQGILRGDRALSRSGGINALLHNAEHEGGPRNGVLTALEDFIVEHDRPVTTVILPAYFGLAVVAETSRIQREPKLEAFFAHLSSRELQAKLLALADDLWLTGLETNQPRVRRWHRLAEAGATRYLDLLAAALLDEHYLENELRLHHVESSARSGRAPRPEVLRHPERGMRGELERLRAQRRTGRVAGDGNDVRPYFPYTVMGRVRLDHLARCLDTVRTQEVAGDLVECGTGRGGGAIFLRGYLQAHSMRKQRVWVADAFRAAPRPRDARRYLPLTADVNSVRDGFQRFGLLDDQVRFLQGSLPDALEDAEIGEVALLRLGDGIEDPLADVLEALYDKVAIGGFVVVEHAALPDRRAAVEAFRERRGIPEALARVDDGAVAWRKLEHVAAASKVALTRHRRAPAAPAAPSRSLDLSVVIVFHDMRREAERTLRSLSRSYQVGVDGIDYEVIAVENGSAPDQVLGEDFVTSFGPEFRYIDLGQDARPSPVRALNRGIAAAGGRHLALMIDGAHVLSPGVLRHGMAGLTSYAPAVVATHQCFVGPRQQYDAMVQGYDHAYEDGLFAHIGWPSRGYELFDIGCPVGDRDWFDSQAETNCLFAPRALLEQSGCLDESFEEPGGGFANLEVFERLAMSPGVNLVKILGEGSFHQMHGGSTTNVRSHAERRRRIGTYRERYADLRGKDISAPRKPVHYVGQLSRQTLQMKSRWRKRPALDGQAGAVRASGETPTGPSDRTPVLMRTELRQEYVAAYWDSRDWTQTTWRGRRVERSPADLLAYQELMHRLQPPWVVAVGVREDDGLLGVLASLLPPHGSTVLAVGGSAGGGPAEHVVRIDGDPDAAETAAAAAHAVGDAGALVLLARASRGSMVARFAHYAPLVPIGGFVVVEDTIVNGHPVLPGFGPGPHEALKTILADELRFEPDLTLERYGPTFNPNGYLVRLRD